jgi:hypothetical protein
LIQLKVHKQVSKQDQLVTVEHVAINTYGPVSTEQNSLMTTCIQLQATPLRSGSFELCERHDNRQHDTTSSVHRRHFKASNTYFISPCVHHAILLPI